MLQKFMSGLLIGLGFSISLVIVLTVWMNFILPFSYTSEPMVTTPHSGSVALPIDEKYPYIENFSRLSLEEKISKSTAVIVTKIKKSESGKYESIVTEILKKQDGVEMYYQVGDVFEDYGDYNKYENEGMLIPNGNIIFMDGSPATMRFSTSYSGNRIGSLGGISMELLRKKCSS